MGRLTGKDDVLILEDERAMRLELMRSLTAMLATARDSIEAIAASL